MFFICVPETIQAGMGRASKGHPTDDPKHFYIADEFKLKEIIIYQIEKFFHARIFFLLITRDSDGNTFLLIRVVQQANTKEFFLFESANNL